MSSIDNMRFLVVDDMVTMRKIVSRQLKGMGASNITEARNGAEAWKLLEEAAASEQPFQFVVSDWNMPEMTGIELLQHCRKHPAYSGVAFLLVTAEAEMSQVQEAVQSGVDNYVVKPFTPDKFMEKFSAVYKKRFGDLPV